MPGSFYAHFIRLTDGISAGQKGYLSVFSSILRAFTEFLANITENHSVSYTLHSFSSLCLCPQQKLLFSFMCLLHFFSLFIARFRQYLFLFTC